MPHFYVGFPTNEDVGMLALQVGEEVEGNDDAAIGAIFKGNDAAVCEPRLHCGEDV